MQLRFASFAVINLREDLHLQECARAGRTKKEASARHKRRPQRKGRGVPSPAPSYAGQKGMSSSMSSTRVGAFGLRAAGAIDGLAPKLSSPWPPEAEDPPPDAIAPSRPPSICI